MLKAGILIAQMMIKLGVSTTKIKYSTQKHMIDQKIYHLCFVVNLMKYLYEIFTPDFLNACQRGLTQNQNESINNMIWSECPKRVLCSKIRFVISVCGSIIDWNEGAHAGHAGL